MVKRRRAEEVAAPSRPAENDDIDDEEESLTDLSDAEEAVAAGRISLPGAGARPSIFNKEGLVQALQDISQELPWIERLEVVAAEPISAADVKDDLKLELAFYGQALAAVTAARGELVRLGVSHRRPDDYFAEMLKSDTHMTKIKDKLLLEQKKITAVDNRKKDKAGSLFSKQVAAEKARTKSADKRSQLDSIKQWRKNSKDSRPDMSREADLEGVLSGGKKGGAAGKEAEGSGKRDGESGGRGSIFKRRNKDEKFGFGGKRKRFEKSNDAKSSKSFRDFSLTKNRAPLPGARGPASGGDKRKGAAGGGARGGAGGRAGKGAARPGKSSRMATKSKATSSKRRE